MKTKQLIPLFFLLSFWPLFAHAFVIKNVDSLENLVLGSEPDNIILEFLSREEDFQAFLELGYSNIKHDYIFPLFGGGGTIDEDRVRKIFERHFENNKKELKEASLGGSKLTVSGLFFLIRLIKEKKIIGFIHALNPDPQEDISFLTDRENVVEVAIFVGQDYAHQSVGLNASKILGKFLTDNTDAKTIIAGCFSDNTPVIKMMDRLKFTQATEKLNNNDKKYRQYFLKLPPSN